jgi:hypothetical protein
VASTCLNLVVTVNPIPLPVYDLSDLAPLYINLDWQVAAGALNISCGPANFVFKVLNGTTGAAADSAVFTLENQTSGV